VSTDAAEARRLSYTQAPVATARQADPRNKIYLSNEGVINSTTIIKWIQNHQIASLGYNVPNPA